MATMLHVPGSLPYFFGRGSPTVSKRFIVFVYLLVNAAVHFEYGALNRRDI
jgi:hypothetical protein